MLARGGFDDLELAIGRVLRIGTAMSCGPSGGRIRARARGRRRGRCARILLGTGLLVLLATPAARVVVSIVEYAKSRDWLFVMLTLIVLMALAASVAAAFWGR